MVVSLYLKVSGVVASTVFSAFLIYSSYSGFSFVHEMIPTVTVDKIQITSRQKNDFKIILKKSKTVENNTMNEKSGCSGRGSARSDWISIELVFFLFFRIIPSIPFFSKLTSYLEQILILRICKESA